jgi:hypothetical protein
LKKVNVPISIFDRGDNDCNLPTVLTPISLNTLNEPEQCLEGDGIIVKASEGSAKYNVLFPSSNTEIPISNGNVVIFDQNETPEIEFTTNVPEG